MIHVSFKPSVLLGENLMMQLLRQIKLLLFITNTTTSKYRTKSTSLGPKDSIPKGFLALLPS